MSLAGAVAIGTGKRILYTGDLNPPGGRPSAGLVFLLPFSFPIYVKR